MTINSEVRAAGPFDGNGVTTSFPFEFKVFADSEVLVVREIEGVELVLELGAGYTVDLNADQDSAPGGSVDLVVPLPVGYTLSMTSALAPLQPVDLTNQGGFYPRVINASLDRLTILVQQLSERLNRALVSPISDGGSGFADLPGADARKGAVLAFDEVTGAPLVGPSIASVGTVSANVVSVNTVAAEIAAVLVAAANVTDITNFADVYYGPSAADPTTRRDGLPLEDGDLHFNTAENAMRVYDGTKWGAVASGSIGSTTFSGDGVATNFVLPASPGAKNNAQVYISGIYQPKSGYELTGVGGTTLVFSVPPAAGTDNIEVITLAPLPVDPFTAEDIVDLIELRSTAVRKDTTTGAASIPSGTEAQRPGAPINGMFRYNSEKDQFEGYQNGAWGQVGGGDHVLSVKWEQSRALIAAGAAASDGQLLSRATYPDAWAQAQAAGLVITDAAWLADPTKRGMYSSGDGSTTFRLPDYNGKLAGSLGAVFLRGDGALSAAIAGVIQRDAMQGHKHETNYNTANSTAVLTATGVLAAATAQPVAYAHTVGNAVNTALGGAAISDGTNGTPRTAAETRPLNVTGCWVIKLFGAVVNAGSADAAQLASDYANLAGRVATLEGIGKPFTKEYVSGELTTTAGGLLTLAHGLGVIPKSVQLEVVATAAVGGTPVGARFDPMVIASGGSYYGAQVTGKTASALEVRTGAGVIRVVTATAGDVLTSAQFKLIVRAWA